MSGKDTGAARAKTRMPEPVRKLIVSLKRRPSVIPLLVLALAFLQYSLSLIMALLLDQINDRIIMHEPPFLLSCIRICKPGHRHPSSHL